MDNRNNEYENIVQDLKKYFVIHSASTKLDINEDQFWFSLNDYINSYFNDKDIPGSIQKKATKYILELAAGSLSNPKFIKKIDDIKAIYDEIDKLKNDIEVLSNASVRMISEREELDKYINFEDINYLIASSGGTEVSTNTLSKWSSKGLLGEQFTEKDICPNSFDNHRTVYFFKENVLDFLISECKVHPKYEILDQVEEGTVLSYVITKDNTLGYHCKDLESNIDTIIVD